MPLGRDAQRRRLWSYLRDKGFGYLQNSVWITPDPLQEEHQILASESINVESLILLDARPCAGETDEQIVAGAWDFQRINNRYTHHRKVLKQRPTGSIRSEAAASALQRWAAIEHEAWLNAVTGDFLLPEQILPSRYLGKRAWQRRKRSTSSSRTANRLLFEQIGSKVRIAIFAHICDQILQCAGAGIQ